MEDWQVCGCWRSMWLSWRAAAATLAAIAPLFLFLPLTLISLQVCTIAHVILTEMQWWADAKIFIASYNASHQLLLLKQKIKAILGVGLRRPKMKGVQSLIGCFWPLCGGGGGGGSAI